MNDGRKDKQECFQCKRLEELKESVKFQFKHPLFSDFFLEPNRYFEITPYEQEKVKNE